MRDADPTTHHPGNSGLRLRGRRVNTVATPIRATTEKDKNEVDKKMCADCRVLETEMAAEEENREEQPAAVKVSPKANVKRLAL